MAGDLTELTEGVARQNHFPTWLCHPECTLPTKSFLWGAIFTSPPQGWTLASRQTLAGDSEPDYTIHPRVWSPHGGFHVGGLREVAGSWCQVEPQQEENVCLSPGAGQSQNTLCLPHGNTVLCCQDAPSWHHEEALSVCHGGVKCQKVQCLCCRAATPDWLTPGLLRFITASELTP